MIRTPPKNARASKRARTKTAGRRRSTYTRVPGVVALGRNAIPPIISNTLVYGEKFTLTTGSGIGTYLFSCNGLYDPNITGTGHQPLYFDQLSELYDHYRVVSSKITITVNTSPTYDVNYGVFIDDDATPQVGNVNTALERTQPRHTKSVSLNDSGYFQPIVMYWNAKTAFGIDNIMTRENLAGNAGANPSETQNFCFWIDNGVVSAPFPCRVQIEYNVIWNERASVLGS